MTIGILGSGLMGGTLGTVLARSGHEVIFSYARSWRKLQRQARRAGPRARPGTPAEAATASDAVVLAVHWSRVADVLKQAGSLKGQVLITCSLPMNADDTSLVVGRTSSGAEQLARRARGARVVSAFGTVPSEVLIPVSQSRRRRRPSLLFAGDDADAKKTAATLIRDARFDPIDAGPLRMARYLEPFTLLMAQLAYESGAGPEIAYHIERFSRRS